MNRLPSSKGWVLRAPLPRSSCSRGRLHTENPWFEAKSDKRRMTLHLCLAGGGCSTRSEPLGLEKSSFDHVRFSSCGRKGSPSAVLHDRLYITGIARSRSASANPSAITFGCKNDGPPRLSESY